MQKLEFRGFLARYVKSLSNEGTNSIYKLSKEACANNFRLREPLLLYALFSSKEKLLLRATKNESLYEEYRAIVEKYTAEEMTKELKTQTGALKEEYYKVWKSFQSVKMYKGTNNDSKELMRRKIKRLQERNKISNYRIYTDLKLNPGNINAWLKHGDGNKVSLETAEKVLNYVKNASNHN